MVSGVRVPDVRFGPAGFPFSFLHFSSTFFYFFFFLQSPYLYIKKVDSYEVFLDLYPLRKRVSYFFEAVQ